nr:MAG TPA: tail assembly chaperone protein [Caudoviricetes sp.]
MGWSDAEFWSSTPRKYEAVFWQYIENHKPPKEKPKTGSEAIADIMKTMGAFQK